MSCEFWFFDRDIGWNVPSRAVKLCLSQTRYEKKEKNCWLSQSVYLVEEGCSALHTWNENMLWKSTCLINQDFIGNWSPFLLTMDWRTGIPKNTGLTPFCHPINVVFYPKKNWISSQSSFQTQEVNALVGRTSKDGRAEGIPSFLSSKIGTCKDVASHWIWKIVPAISVNWTLWA